MLYLGNYKLMMLKTFVTSYKFFSPKILTNGLLHHNYSDDGSSTVESMIQNKIDNQILKEGEPLEQKRSRLLYQSRKRGTAENCLLFGTFSAKYLSSLTEDQLNSYDRLLNDYLNEWEIYYWLVGKKPVPKAYDNDLMVLLQKHCRNEDKEKRFKQPDLY